MEIKTVVLNFQGTKTEGEIYQIVLGNLEEMLVGIGDNLDLLQKLKDNLRDKLAQVSNRHYLVLRKLQNNT